MHYYVCRGWCVCMKYVYKNEFVITMQYYHHCSCLCQYSFSPFHNREKIQYNTQSPNLFPKIHRNTTVGLYCHQQPKTTLQLSTVTTHSCGVNDTCARTRIWTARNNNNFFHSENNVQFTHERPKYNYVTIFPIFYALLFIQFIMSLASMSRVWHKKAVEKCDAFWIRSNISCRLWKINYENLLLFWTVHIDIYAQYTNIFFYKRVYEVVGYIKWNGKQIKLWKIYHGISERSSSYSILPNS